MSQETGCSPAGSVGWMFRELTTQRNAGVIQWLTGVRNWRK